MGTGQVDQQALAEYRYRAVREVLGGSPIGEVAERYGTTRQSLHSWRKRLEAEGIPGLADRSRRPKSSPSRVEPEVEALICQLRREHPRWGARRIVHELGQRSAPRVPGRATVHRVLERNGLVRPQEQRHQRKYRRWQRDAPMQLRSWTSSAASPWPTAGKPSWSPGSMTAPGSSWFPRWSRCRPGGRSARRSPPRCAATGCHRRC